jgi:hypothetical protein
MSEELDLNGTEITLLDEEEELLDEEEELDPIDEKIQEALFDHHALLADLYVLLHWAKEGAPSEAHKAHIQDTFDDAKERLLRLTTMIMLPWAKEYQQKMLIAFVEGKINEAPPDSKEREYLNMCLGMVKEVFH